MFRKSLLALALLLSGTGCAVADNTNVMTMPQATSAAQTKMTDAGYPSEPGPYTVIYRAWSDLAG